VNAFWDTKTTEGFAIVGAFSPLLHAPDPRRADGLLRAAELRPKRHGHRDRGVRHRGRNGRLVRARFGFVDTAEYRLEASAIWSPVKDLDIGVDVL
jgi:hypothetical protein